MQRVRRTSREELLNDCDVIRHSLRANDLSTATSILEGLIEQIDLLPTELSHTLETGLRGILDFFIVQQMRDQTLTKDNNVRFVIDSLLTFYSKHTLKAIKSQTVSNSLKSLVFSLKQVFLILRHPPQNAVKQYTNYPKIVIAIWDEFVNVFCAPSGAYPESLLEILSDCLDEFFKLSLFTKGIQEMMLNISFSHISAASGVERKAKTKFFITISRFGNMQFTNALSLVLNSLEKTLCEDPELETAFRLDNCSALDLILKNPNKYKCIIGINSEELKRSDFEGVLRFFAEMHSVTNSKVIYVLKNYFLLYFTVIWIGLNVTSITSVIVNAVDCFNAYSPTLFESGVETESTLLLLTKIIQIFNDNNGEKKNERLYSASKTIIAIMSLLLNVRFDLFEQLLHGDQKESVMYFVHTIIRMIDDVKIRDKTEQIGFVSTLITAVFNQPRNRHAELFSFLSIDPNIVFDSFIKLTNSLEANVKAAYLALAKGINVLIDADIQQHATLLWRLVDIFFTIPVTYSFGVTCTYLRSLQQLKLNKLFRAEQQHVSIPHRNGIYTIVWDTIRYFLRSPNEAIGEAAAEVGGTVGVSPNEIIHDPIYLVNELRCVLYGNTYNMVFPRKYVLPRQKNPLNRKKSLISYAMNASFHVLQCHNSVLSGNAVNTKIKSLTNAVTIISYAALAQESSENPIYYTCLEYVLRLLHCSLNVFHPQIILQANQFNVKCTSNILLSRFGEEMAEMYSIASHNAVHPTETFVDELLYCLAVLIRRCGVDIISCHIFDISSYVKLYHIDHLLACVSILNELSALSSGAVIPTQNDNSNSINSSIFRAFSKPQKKRIDCSVSPSFEEKRRTKYMSGPVRSVSSSVSFDATTINVRTESGSEESFVEGIVKPKPSCGQPGPNRLNCSVKLYNDIKKERKRKYQQKGYTLTDLQGITNQWVPQKCKDKSVWLQTNILTNLVVSDMINGFSLDYDERCILMDYTLKFCKAGFTIGAPDFTVSKKTNVFMHNIEESLSINYKSLYTKLFAQYKKDASQVDNFKSLYQQNIPSHFVIPGITSINFEDVESVKKFIVYVQRIDNYHPNYHCLSAIEIGVSAQILYNTIMTMRGVKTFDQYGIDDLFDIFKPRTEDKLCSIHEFYDMISDRYKDNEKVHHDSTVMSVLLQGFYESMLFLAKVGNATDPISRALFRTHQDLLWGSIFNHDLFYLNDTFSLRNQINSLLKDALKEINKFPVNERPDAYKQLVEHSTSYVDEFTHPALKYYADKNVKIEMKIEDSNNQKIFQSFTCINDTIDSLVPQQKTQLITGEVVTIGAKFGIVSTLEEAIKEFTETCEAERAEMLRELLIKEMKNGRFDPLLIDFTSMTINTIDLITKYLRYGQPSEVQFYKNLSKIPQFYRSFKLYEAILYHFTKFGISFKILENTLNCSVVLKSSPSDPLDQFCEMSDLIYSKANKVPSALMKELLFTPLNYENGYLLYNSYFIGHAPFSRNDKYTKTDGIVQEKMFTPLYSQTNAQHYSSMILPLMENVIHELFLRRLGDAQSKYGSVLPVFKDGRYVNSSQELLHSEFWNYRATPVSSELEALEAIQCIRTYTTITSYTEQLVDLVCSLLDRENPNQRLLSILVSLLITSDCSNHRRNRYIFTQAMELNELILCSPFLVDSEPVIPQYLSISTKTQVYRKLREFFQDRFVITTYMNTPQFYQLICLLNFQESPVMFLHIVNNSSLKNGAARRCLVDLFLTETMLCNQNVDIKQLKDEYSICFVAMVNAYLLNPKAIFELIKHGERKKVLLYVNMILSHYFNTEKTSDIVEALTSLDWKTENLSYPIINVIVFILMIFRHSAFSDSASFVLEKLLKYTSLVEKYRYESGVLINTFSEIPDDYITLTITSIIKQLFTLICHPHST
ncbi:hypothetical protein EIN_222340 [Entamoeba invadens IP1]|uniref:Uncharacterized protein n=1 Tax=Entamoeba invadens IP1 TaxID=370355 RepID=A0A0A1U207_ENTIV|nr:hypothetical protein EIN_222340 [Entamoeba invadens IP1]ELP88091.1 hypothetical protein EIN_222340 [Entamoeba invadens IP1]|eukprot:XP_004254862.1 hypothetical protein EIN_222340 [Entamoeba invadens IP1]